MITYCPTCANMLLVEHNGGALRYFCQTCPYQYVIDRQITTSIPLKKKQVESVVSFEDQMKNAQKTAAACGKCCFPQAYFMEIQIRSADEPATLFYKCVECGYQWKEG